MISFTFKKVKEILSTVSKGTASATSHENYNVYDLNTHTQNVVNSRLNNVKSKAK